MAHISERRKAVYYLGMALAVLGFISFISVFFSAALDTKPFENFDEKGRSSGLRAMGGMVTIIAGFILARIGRLGAAGSGVVLNPKQARKDVEPWSRMVGGVVNDALDEVDAVKKLGSPAEVVKIRCLACRALNEEGSKFCEQCGKPV